MAQLTFSFQLRKTPQMYVRVTRRIIVVVMSICIVIVVIVIIVISWVIAIVVGRCRWMRIARSLSMGRRWTVSPSIFFLIAGRTT